MKNKISFCLKEWKNKHVSNDLGHSSQSSTLTAKTFADHNATRYTYDVNGKLASRIWARGITTHYAYDLFGQLLSTPYSDSTPSITNAYDALGNLSQVIDAKGTTVFTYNNYGNVISEAIEGIYSKVLTKSYDSFGRNIGYELDNIPKASYSYHVNTGRLTQMLPEGFGEPFTFMYQANSHLLESIIGPIVTQTVEYEDARDLIKSVTHSGNVGTHYATYSYTNDLLGRRTTKIQNSNNEVKDFDFGYNARSEVTSANETGNTNFQYGFNYDNIGNRITANENGIPKSYATNALNQYAISDSTFIPTYDPDGNQTRIKTSRGIWNVTYNGENRPVKFIQGDTVISMSYDYMGRRFEKTVIIEGNIETSQKFVYNNYLQIEELNGNNESIKSYLWDPIAEDATRPLMLTDHALEQSSFFTHDANNNVVDLIDEGGMVAVHYEYSPFGAITLNTNPSFDNKFSFSSEYSDVELDLIYYNYRHYNHLNGRWLSRDPIEEKGGYNLYGIVRNRIINQFDILDFCEVGAFQVFDTSIFITPALPGAEPNQGNPATVLADIFRTSDVALNIINKIRILKSGGISGLTQEMMMHKIKEIIMDGLVVLDPRSLTTYAEIFSQLGGIIDDTNRQLNGYAAFVVIRYQTCKCFFWDYILV